MRDKIDAYITEQYGAAAEFPWEQYGGHAVYRHSSNRKWFALIMKVARDKVGAKGEGLIDVINLKVDDIPMREVLFEDEGIMPAYHMNKNHWITVLLDGTVPEETVRALIDVSFNATAPKRKKKK
ncbi:MAG: MmcQ/YjbR family DNA-binding protein [Saccharofermentans sp.]|nr:MmcQ/YjbR family DNA-binding protein [Saccharofermentans sp.]